MFLCAQKRNSPSDSDREWNVDSRFGRANGQTDLSVARAERIRHQLKRRGRSAESRARYAGRQRDRRRAQTPAASRERLRADSIARADARAAAERDRFVSDRAMFAMDSAPTVPPPHDPKTVQLLRTGAIRELNAMLPVCAVCDEVVQPSLPLSMQYRSAAPLHSGRRGAARDTDPFVEVTLHTLTAEQLHELNSGKVLDAPNAPPLPPLLRQQYSVSDCFPESDRVWTHSPFACSGFDC